MFSNELRKEGENKENVVPEQMESVAVLKKQLEAVKDVLTTRQKFEKGLKLNKLHHISISNSSFFLI